MKTEQMHWRPDLGWDRWPEQDMAESAQLALVFGARGVLCDHERLADVSAAYPNAEVLGCSTSGEICGAHVSDDSMVVTAIRFGHTAIRVARFEVGDFGDSRRAGQDLAEELKEEDLVHILAFSDGLVVNGSELVGGFMDRLPAHVQVTGGLAGDGTDFRETLIVAGGRVRSREVAAVGLYGDRLKVGYGSFGGWDPFGPERMITRSEGNVLFEFDGRSALELYKHFLGEFADVLPANALLFPLSIRSTVNEPPIVRTVLAIDEAEGSMEFAGDLPEGSYARLMKANPERLIDGATDAADAACETMGAGPPDFALLISCVGRKMVLRQRVEEEVEAAQRVMGDKTTLAGFYSYGEIAPCAPGEPCVLHNQTMTITTLTET